MVFINPAHIVTWHRRRVWKLCGSVKSMMSQNMTSKPVIFKSSVPWHCIWKSFNKLQTNVLVPVVYADNFWDIILKFIETFSDTMPWNRRLKNYRFWCTQIISEGGKSFVTIMWRHKSTLEGGLGACPLENFAKLHFKKCIFVHSRNKF